MNATISAPHVLALHRFQFSLADVACWTTYVAVTLASWNVNPFFTFLCVVWAVPAFFRHRALCRQLDHVTLWRKELLLIVAVLCEIAISSIAVITSVSLFTLLTLLAMVAALATGPSEPGIIVAWLILLLACLSLLSFPLFYEFLRRCTWPTATEPSESLPEDWGDSLATELRAVKHSR